MKSGVWKLIILATIGICWGWYCHVAVATSVRSPLPILPEIDRDNAIEIALVKDRVDRNLLVNNYRANGEWIGRLILPSQEQIAQSPLIDWVWIEIKHAPEQERQLVGKTLRLIWKPKSQIESDSRRVTTDIKFTAGTIASHKEGTIHPQRLNGRSHVGALQSLAGARAEDDVVVKLFGVGIGGDVITIDREPIQITGKSIGLVEIIGTDTSRKEPLPTACPGYLPCPSEYIRVRHYNPLSHAFDGQMETIRIPQLPAKKSGLFPSTIRDLARSPVGSQGWYIYGNFTGEQPNKREPQGVFTVTAIQPRALLQLTAPALNLTESDAKLDYLNRQHWENIAAKKGRLERVTFNRKPERLGDRALVIHLFGGIGGKTPDSPGVPQTVTGHFAYGIATVVQDEFTDELRWSIEYHQVYAHNRDGIVAGKQDWATYMGHLQRGWAATRPVADALISYPPVTEDYDFGGIKLSPLAELQRQLAVSAARYRSGDGTGNASVTPATSCVQDANQALYLTIRQLTREVKSQPQIRAWLNAHPQHPQTVRFRDLTALGVELERNLAPLGIVRQDWQQNAAKLAGTDLEQAFTTSGNPILGLMSWRTMLPRGAQDGMAKIFSQRGAAIWFLNTYQVGGWNADIIPISPTILFGQIPLLSTMIVRLWAGIVTLPNLGGWLSVLGLLVGYSLVALVVGFKSQFLTFERKIGSLPRLFKSHLRSIAHLFLMPAVLEEFLFRLLLIPHPVETAIASNIYFWLAISLGLFILYHPLNALTFYKPGQPTFMGWRFLALTGLLGLVCSIAYLLTGSIWAAVLIHWVVVVAWLKVFGGDRLLQ